MCLRHGFAAPIDLPMSSSSCIRSFFPSVDVLMLLCLFWHARKVPVSLCIRATALCRGFGYEVSCRFPRCFWRGPGLVLECFPRKLAFRLGNCFRSSMSLAAPSMLSLSSRAALSAVSVEEIPCWSEQSQSRHRLPESRTVPARGLNPGVSLP